MGKRLHIASKQYKLSNKEMAELLGKLGFKIKAHPFSAVSDEMLTALEKHFAGGADKAEKAKPQAKAKPADKKPEKKSEKDKKPSKKPAAKDSSPSKPQSEKGKAGKKLAKKKKKK